MTIIERKFLSKIQRRIGPKRYITQAIIDGIKIIIKERLYREENKYYISCILNILVAFTIWELLPINFYYQELNINMDILLYLILASINVYPIIYGGIGSNNKYTLLSVIRGINQLISYEINITIGIITLIFLSRNFNIMDICLTQIDYFYFNPLFFLLFFSFLAETNRIPFDLLEAESELIGRFNYRIWKYRIYINIYYWIFYDNN